MRDEQAMWERLTEVFREVFDDDELVIGPETTAEDIEGWESLTHIQLIVAIEKAFDNVKFNTGEIANLKNVGDIVALIARSLARR